MGAISIGSTPIEEAQRAPAKRAPPTSASPNLSFALLRAQNGVAAKLLLEAAPLVAIDPAEDTRVRRVGSAKGHSVGPVLREAVLLRHGPESRAADRHLQTDCSFSDSERR